MTQKCVAQFNQFEKPGISHQSFHFTVPHKFVKPIFPSRPYNSFYRTMELHRKPGTAWPAPFYYIFFVFSPELHIIHSEPFLQKLIQWNSPSSCWKHPWLMAQVTGKARPGLQHTLMGFPLLPLVCYSQSRFCSAVWCIHVKDYIAWILHHYTPNSWAKRGTHLICKTKNLFLV